MFPTMNRTLTIFSGNTKIETDENDKIDDVLKLLDHTGITEKIKKDVTKLKSDSNIEIKEIDKNENISFKEAEEIFFNYNIVMKRNLSKSTLAAYKTMFNYIYLFTDKHDSIYKDKKFFIEMRKTILKLPKNFLKTYTKEDITKFTNNKNSKIETMSAKTINDMFARIKNFYKVMIEEDRIDYNPIEHLSRLTEEKGTKKEYYTDDEVKEIIENLKEREFKNLFLFGIYTGMRLGEILSIRIKDLNPDRTLRVRGTKTQNAERLIYLHDKLLEVYEEQKKYSKNEFLFFSEYEDKELDQKQKLISKRINPRLHKIITNKNKTFHSTRKSFNQKLLNNNVEKWKVNKILGHSQEHDVNISKYHKDLTVKQLKEAFEKVQYN